MGSGSYFVQLGHFFKFAPKHQIAARDYGVARYGMEVQRCLSVLDMVLAKSKSGFISDWGYSIADIAIWPWISGIDIIDVREFLSVDKYEHVKDWASRIGEREAVLRGLKVTPMT